MGKGCLPFLQSVHGPGLGEVAALCTNTPERGKDQEPERPLSDLRYPGPRGPEVPDSHRRALPGRAVHSAPHRTNCPPQAPQTAAAQGQFPQRGLPGRGPGISKQGHGAEPLPTGRRDGRAGLRGRGSPLQPWMTCSQGSPATGDSCAVPPTPWASANLARRRRTACYSCHSGTSC